ncbi:hypothetical protein QYF36_007591 [Acer negundo]|nr:hypothetical protein QYF36_007591 [Acer negundo]
MNITWNSCFVVVVVCINYFCCLVNSQPFGYPTANLSTKWTNSPSAPHSVDFNDGSTVRAILLRGALGFGPRYACGFFCNGNCDTYLFAIYIVQTNSGGGMTYVGRGFPQVVWSANRDNPVKLNATVDLTSDGDLILRDVGASPFPNPPQIFPTQSFADFANFTEFATAKLPLNSPTAPPQSFVGGCQPVRQRFRRSSSSSSSSNEFVATAKLLRRRRRSHPSSPSVFFQHPPLSDAAIHHRFGCHCIWLEVKYMRLVQLELVAWEVTLKEEPNVLIDLLRSLGGLGMPLVSTSVKAVDSRDVWFW